MPEARKLLRRLWRALRRGQAKYFPLSWRDTKVSAEIVMAAVLVCAGLLPFEPSGGFAYMVFVLAVVCIARFTAGYFYGVCASFVGVVCTNYIFTYPYWDLNFTIAGYPLTFLVMLAVSLITSAMTTQIREHERERAEGEKEKLRANLLRAISHDIRTPLTSIIGSVSAVLESGDRLSRETQKQLLSHAQEEAKGLITLVENLLSITRMNSENTLITKQPEVLEEVVGGAVQKFRGRCGGVQIQVAPPGEIALVSMDATLVEQVLLNLMENAVVHGRGTTRIDISFRQEAEWVTILVADDGGGVAPALLPHILEDSFVQIRDQRTDAARNMGIGLSVCRSIIAAHGGTMGVRNTGRGAEFSVTLPLQKEEEESHV